MAIREVDGLTLLHIAAREGNAECVDVLLAATTHAPAWKDVTDRWNRTAMHYAALGEYENIVIALETSGANSYTQDYTGQSPWPYLAWKRSGYMNFP